MAASDKVLVYHYRHGGSPAVQDGLAVITRQELGEILHGNPNLQSGTKTIPHGARSIDVHQRDLVIPSLRSVTDQYPNSEENVAGVKVPRSIWLRSIITRTDSELIILNSRAS